MTTPNTESVAELAVRLVETHFKEHPFKIYELEVFVAPKDGLLAGLMKDVRIPRDPSNAKQNVPCLLLHGLDNLDQDELSSTKAYQFIDETKDTCSALYGTSGAGKTRSVYEYLSQNFGLYFVAKTTNDPGSKDLDRLMILFKNFRAANALDGGDSQDETAKLKLSQRNYSAMDRFVVTMIHIRNLVFAAINNHLTINELPELTPYQWLLIQLFPAQALKNDLFHSVFNACIIADNGNKNKGDASVVSEFMALQPKKWSTIVVDEAQVLLKKLPDFFLCSDGNAERSAFSAVLKSITNAAELADAAKLAEDPEDPCGFPLVCGTGISIDDLKEQSNSVLMKRPHNLAENKITVFKEFNLLGANAVKDYIFSILKIESASEESTSQCVPDVNVVDHVSLWLRGRPRWTASFLEVYLVRKGHADCSTDKSRTRGNFSLEGGKLMEAMDRYIDAYATGTTSEIPQSESRASVDPPEGTAYSAIKRVATGGRYQLVKKVEAAIFKFAVGGQPVFLQGCHKTLIEVGVAALSTAGEDKVVFDEPMMVQAGINYFSIEQTMADNLAAQEDGGQGAAFEKLMLPAIQKRLPDILREQLQAPGDILKDFWVSSRSSYGVLALDCKTDINATIKWIEDATAATFEGQVPPFCYPDTSIGPDLMFLLWNERYTNYIPTISQAKFRKCLNQMEALRTITPSLLYCENRGKVTPGLSNGLKTNDALNRRWEAVKPKLVGQEHGCVRFMVQYPCNQTLSAKPGVLEDDMVTTAKSLDSTAAPSATDGSTEPNVTTIKRKRKLGWLATVSKDNASQLFQGDGLKVLKALKGSD
eukprot:scaffold52711_cov63-Attheya_sp.AAC.2